MKMDHASQKRGHIIACSVFQPALESLFRDHAFSGFTLSYIPSHLHLYPNILKESLLKAIYVYIPENIPIVLLYGSCFPGIDDFCQEHAIKRIRGDHCFEIMLGSKRFQAIMEETAGTYFLEQDLILNFQTYCIEPLELHDEEMRRLCLGHYQRLIYLRQPNDPELALEVEAISRFLNLPAATLQVGYSHLKKRLLEVLVDNSSQRT